MFSKFSNFSGPLSSLPSFNPGSPAKLLLLLDSSYYNPYTTDFTFDFSSPTASYGVVTGMYGVNSVTSTTEGGNWDNKQAMSNESYSGPVKLKFQRGSISQGMMCGLSQYPYSTSALNYNKPNYGFYLQNDTYITIVEGGNFSIGIIQLDINESTVYTIIYDGAEVRYFIDDILVYVSLTKPTAPLYLYTTFLNAGLSFINIEFGENTNTNWSDSSENGNKFDLQNSPNYSNKSLYFNSLEGQYAIGDDLGDLNKFTVNTWFNLKSIPISGFLLPQIITNIYDIPHPSVNFAIGFLQNDIRIYGGFFVNGSWTYTDGFSPEIDTWYNTVLTYDGKNLNFYLNGNILSSTTYNLLPISSGLGINIAKRWDLDDFIDGNIDIVEIWNNALGQNQILNNYNIVSNRYILNEGSLLFDGSTTWLEVAASNDWKLLDTYTIEFWSKAAKSSTGRIFTILSQKPDFSTSIDIYYSENILYVQKNTALCAEPTPEVWTHVAIVCDRGSLSVYYGGVNQGVYSGTSLEDKNGIAIGRRGISNNFQYFEGELYGIKISNIAVYDRPFDPYVAFPPVVDGNTLLLITDYQPYINTFLDTSNRHILYNAGASYSSDIPHTTKGRYIRWIITQTKAPDTYDNGSVQAAELVLLYKGSTVIWNPSAIASNPDGFSLGEIASDLLDNNPNTKWCNIIFGTTSYGISTIYIDNIVPVTFDSYYYITGNDLPERDPITWTLAISNDNSTWQVIDTQTEVSITDSRQADTQVFIIN